MDYFRTILSSNFPFLTSILFLTIRYVHIFWRLVKLVFHQIREYKELPIIVHHSVEVVCTSQCIASAQGFGIFGKYTKNSTQIEPLLF